MALIRSISLTRSCLKNDRRGISVLSGTKSRRPRRFQGMLTNVSRAWAGKPPSADEVRKRKAEQPRFGSNPDHATYRQDRVFAVSFQRNVRPCSLLATQLPYPVRVGGITDMAGLATGSARSPMARSGHFVLNKPRMSSSIFASDQ